MKTIDWVGLAFYLLFNAILEAIGIDIFDSPVSWILLNMTLLMIDIRQHSRGYREGLQDGANVTKQIHGISRT